ncbi:hypothetical protein MNV49_003746 [Pseudohyphozyma bogoriensis]|nr:hypothetical protein MNV49_003746 [Pseudohyphozyma bogoriensis]
MSATTGLITYTATGTLGATVTTTLPLTATAASAVQNILDPAHEDPTSPIVLFIIQLAIIIGFSRFLSLFLVKLRQPRVIGEILGGILLGPTAFGRIPGFTSHIFPTESISYLTLFSTFGLVLFLFIVGMEVDFTLFKKNFRVSVAVASAGIVIPFGLGCAVSVGLYKEFSPESVPFSHFMLFIGTSMSITAFPVLARILSELNLLSDRVGLIVLSSGVANDVIGWLLLALTIALVNAASGLVVLYVILTAIGWLLALWFIVRPVFNYLARKSGSFDGRGPTQSIVCAALFICFASAWVTEEIGINAIFGGFCAGLIIPRGHGFATHLTEKIEDLIVTLFIPIYFAQSGLKTNLGLLDSGIIWGWTVCVIVVSFCGKFIGCASSARFSGFTNRESLAVGSLMSAKGLIELIVLNVGLGVGVITTTVFSIFVLEALLLTFFATPLTLAFYPLHLRHASDPSATTAISPDDDTKSIRSFEGGTKAAVTMVLERIENLGAVMVATRLLSTPPSYDAGRESTEPLPSGMTSVASESALLDAAGGKTPAIPQIPTIVEPAPMRGSPVTVNTIRLVELTDRTSAVMQASEMDDTLRNDPMMLLYETFCSLNGVEISQASLDVVNRSAFANVVAGKARDRGSDLIVAPWTLTEGDEKGLLASLIPNPLEALFRTPSLPNQPTYASFIRSLFLASTADVALFLDRGSTSPSPSEALAGSYHLFLPFHGGSDDRACLSLLLRLLRGNIGVRATVIRFIKSAEDEPEPHVDTPGLEAPPPLASPALTIGSGIRTGAIDTMYPTSGSMNVTQSQSLDEVAFASLPSHPRLTSQLIATPTPLASSLATANLIAKSNPTARLTTLVGRGRRAAPSHRKELEEVLGKLRDGEGGIARSSEVRKSLGEVATAVLLDGVGSNIVVVQSGDAKGVTTGV